MRIKFFSIIILFLFLMSCSNSDNRNFIINKKEYKVSKLSTENNELYGSVKPTEISKLINEFDISVFFCKTAGLPASLASLNDWTIGI